MAHRVYKGHRAYGLWGSGHMRMKKLQRHAQLSQGDATLLYRWLSLLLSLFLSPSGSREQGAAQRYTACCPTTTRVNKNLMRSLRDLRPDFVARSAIAGDPVRFQTTSLLC